MRKILISLLCLLMIMPILAQDNDTVNGVWQCPGDFSGQTLDVYNWSTYIADNTIPDFEAACDVEVNYVLFDSDDEVLDIIRQGNPADYDIIMPGGAILSELISEELVVPLDMNLIPNADNILAELLNPSFDEGNEYSLPYQWGTIAAGYNTDAFPDGITSWDQVWEHEGSVGWLNDARAVIGTALIMLGYDPNSIEVSEILEARNYLGNRGGDNLTIYPDSEGQDALANGDVDVIIEYSGDIIDLTYECECEDFAYTIPDEGANVWIDNMAIPVGGSNIELAHAFIDYILDPQVGADISNFTAYGSPNRVAIESELIDAGLLANPGIYPSDSVRENLFFVQDLGSEINDLYRNAWNEILLFFGE